MTEMSIQVITAVMEPGDELLQTALSIRSQTHQYWRWYIANGGSICASLAKIIELNDPRIVINSQHDSGIYDAWNKACSNTMADWTIFLGSGDKLSEATVLEQTSSQLKALDPSQPRIAFGWCRLISHRTGQILRVQKNDWVKMQGKYRYGKPSLPIHPETFHSAGLLNCEKPFETSFSVAGDVDVMLRALRYSKPISLPYVISDVITGGVSQDPMAGFRIYKEVRLACARNDFHLPIYVRVIEYIRTGVKYFANRLIGKSMYEKTKEVLLSRFFDRSNGAKT